MKHLTEQAYKTCHKKLRYKTWDIATRAAKQLTKRYKVDLYAYDCPICNGYHLTKKEIILEANNE